MSIEVLDESGLGLDVRRTQQLARFVMDRMRVHPLAELCVSAVDEDTIAELNAKWMDKEGPTDVLAFPMDELRPGQVSEDPEEGVLGDLVLCPAVAHRQAVEAGHSTTDELDLLTVHGSCTCSGTTTRSPTRRPRCSASRAPCSPTGEPVAGSAACSRSSSSSWCWSPGC